MKCTYIQVLIAVILSACSQSQEKEDNTVVEQQTYVMNQEKQLPVVDVVVLKYGDFAQEILSNGLLSSVRRADLHLKTAGTLTKIYVKNGDHVDIGQTLAEIDLTDLKAELKQAEENKKKSYLDMQDFLIGQGYKLSDSLKVPSDKKELAAMKSGYGQACMNYSKVQKQLYDATLRAPFTGVIANISAKPHNFANTGEIFCTLMDNSSMEVTFPVMENEIHDLRRGDTVRVSLYSKEGNFARGHIASINPLIDENGLVKVCAIVPKTPKQWFDGMKAMVNIQRNLSNQLVVPKEAVVMRDGRRVVFTVRNEKAYWNYVSIGYENSSSYTIAHGLHKGDSIIISGNKNLAHLTPIIINGK